MCSGSSAISAFRSTRALYRRPCAAPTRSNKANAALKHGRHGRTRCGHPRLRRRRCSDVGKAWVTGTSPVMTKGRLGSADLAAELVFDVGAHDVVEGRLGHKSELRRAHRIEALGPAGDDAGDDGV